MVNPISAITLPVSLLVNTLQSVGKGSDSDGDGDRSRVQATGGGSGEQERFLDAILQALSRAGVTGRTGQTEASAASSPDSSPSTTQDPVQALGIFMDALFAALQAQSAQGLARGGASTGQQGSGGDSGVKGVQGTSGNVGRHLGAGAGGMEARLQGLVQQLSSGLSPSGGSQTALEQSFDNLLSALGDSGSKASIGTFLQALSQTLRGAGPTGNVVNTLV